jgi:hypothetical protein
MATEPDPFIDQANSAMGKFEVPLKRPPPSELEKPAERKKWDDRLRRLLAVAPSGWATAKPSQDGMHLAVEAPWRIGQTIARALADMMDEDRTWAVDRSKVDDRGNVEITLLEDGQSAGRFTIHQDGRIEPGASMTCGRRAALLWHAESVRRTSTAGT